jgi:G3E family GTPase
MPTPTTLTTLTTSTISTISTIRPTRSTEVTVHPLDRPPIPVTVLGGYLGAGKTTLVNHVLRESDGSRIAVLVNDFGALAIDADLIRSRDGDTIQLTNGCICCSLAAGFADAMFGIRALQDPPDRVLVEASGVSDPLAVAQYAHLPGFRLDSVIVLADAETVRTKADDRFVGRHVREQLAHADLVLLNKVDLVDDERRRGVRVWLGALTDAPVVETVEARVPTAVLFGLTDPSTTRVTPVRSADRSGAPTHDHAAEYESWAIEIDGPIGRDRFDQLVGSLPTTVVRAKGIVAFDDDPGTRYVFHLVGARRTLTADGPWDSQTPRTRIVVIAPASTEPASTEPSPPADQEHP